MKVIDLINRLKDFDENEEIFYAFSQSEEKLIAHEPKVTYEYVTPDFEIVDDITIDSEPKLIIFL